MKQDYTHIQVLLDRSGSMESIRKDTEGGFATFLKEQQSNPGTATIGLDQFDTEYQVVYAPVNIKTVDSLVLVPRGMTALLDAMGKSITKTGEWLASLKEEKRPGTVIFVVITDGEENSSREWTREQVFDLVTKQQEEWKWVFVFLAANQDAIATGTSMGFDQGTTMTYDATPFHTRSTYSTLSRSVTRTRAAGAMGQSTNTAATFTDEERKAASDQS